MPVLFNKRRRPPLPSTATTGTNLSTNFPTRPSSASLHAGQHAFHRADSASSKRTFHSGVTSSSGTVIQRPPPSPAHRSASERSGGVQSTGSARSPAPPKGFFRRFKAEFKYFYKRRHIKYLVPLIGVVVYMFIGACLFYWLESGAEEERLAQKARELQREKSLLLKRMEEILQDKAALQPEKRGRFIEEAVDHFHKQMDIHFALEAEWTFLAAMYFAGTLFTTIGYGDIACQTAVGRAITVIYGIFGVPVMLMTLNDLGKFLFKSINEFLDYMKVLSTRFRKKKEDQVAIMEQGEAMSQSSKTRNSIDKRRVSFALRHGSETITLDQLSLDMEAVGTQGEPSDDAVFNDDELISIQQHDLEQQQHQPLPIQNMPVTVALFITIGWIFFCAALFQLWEDWTYTESWYFMCISMSTIGLGDVSVKRRDMMVLCFLFVIIGLSLVSMCINVIQTALEDLYKKMLMKLLLDYQAKLSKEGDHEGASVGMMKMWGRSKTAKYLMPMLSADTRRHVMNQIQEEAKETGVELPPIFNDLDEKTGMPRILAAVHEKKRDDDDPEKVDILELVRQTDPTRVSVPSRSPLPTIVCYEADTQTDAVLLNDNTAQTLEVSFADLGVQTEFVEPTGNDQEQQTETDSGIEEESQTPILIFIDSETMTSPQTFMSLETQTERILTKEQQMQTQIIDILDNEMQTEFIETQNIRSQTDEQTFEEIAVQTDPMEVPEPPKVEEDEKLNKMNAARRRIRKAFKKRAEAKRRVSTGDNVVDLEEDEIPEENANSAGSYESLDWNPVDGLHAERQRPVSDLKRLFDSFKSAK
uniref:Ion_trans_2 domain-containing protein n=1 Tax=Panagrellus redivivus TaxID=6233 RepID=A0A7E4V272_PANRE